MVIQVAAARLACASSIVSSANSTPAFRPECVSSFLNGSYASPDAQGARPRTTERKPPKREKTGPIRASASGERVRVGDGPEGRNPLETGRKDRSPQLVGHGLRLQRETVAASKMVEAAGIEPASGCPSSGPSTWVVVPCGSQLRAARRLAASQPSHRWCLVRRAGDRLDGPAR